MTAAPKTLVFEQGATFTFGFNWHRQELDGDGNPVEDEDGNPVAGDPYDLTGCSARMQIRKRVNSEVLATATSKDPVDAEAIAAGAGRIKLGGADGRIDITLTDQDTDALTIKEGVYDLEIEWPLQPGELRPRVDRLLQGPILNSLNVTKVDT